MEFLCCLPVAIATVICFFVIKNIEKSEAELQMSFEERNENFA